MPTKRPNVLWFCTDQQRFDTIHALGNRHIRTPNLDRLVENGVAFTHAFCQSPICTPSRASFLTGMYPSTVHACMNGNEHWANAAPLITKRLADSGYECGLSGKLHLSTSANGRCEERFDDGYQFYHWSHDSSDRWSEGHAYADWLREQGYSLAELRKKPENIPPKLHQTTWCTDKAIEFITAQHEGPWLMSVNVFDPHGPFDPPEEFLRHYDQIKLPDPLFSEGDLIQQDKLHDVDFQKYVGRPEETANDKVVAKYYAMIELIDHNIGRLLDTLEATGQLENTMVIFTSDHGEMLGDHGLLLKGCRFYEGLVRVPLIISWPSYFEAGLRSDALVELTDIAPTLMEVAGIDCPTPSNALELAKLPAGDRVQGRSLVPILTGKVNPQYHRDFVRCEYYNVLDPMSVKSNFIGSYGTMYRDKRFKLVVYHGYAAGELYDLDSDPNEFVNLWDDPTYTNVKLDLMKRSFDASILATDIGPRRVGSY